MGQAADDRDEIDRLSRLVEEGERAIVRQLDDINRASGPVIEARKFLLAMIDAVSVQRLRLEALRGFVKGENSSN